ncbi:MAG: FAD:protein FMN transferase [Verrucomicrobiota bacterium]
MSTGNLTSVWVRLWRLCALGIAVVLLNKGLPPSPKTETSVSLVEAQAFFPSATELRAPTSDGTLLVYQGEEPVGRLWTTSPQSDGIIGYSGPSNLLVALDSEGKIVGIKVLSSGDTPSHVRHLQEHTPFWNSFLGWKPETQPLPKIEALSGSTLTSLAMAEALVKRASGKGVSLRFPEPLALSEAQGMFPTASSFLSDSPKAGWFQVMDPDQATLGYVVRTSPASDSVSGYAGPTECLIAIAPDQERLVSLKIRKTYDTEEYTDRVREDTGYAKLLTRWKVSEWPAVDFEKEHIEGVAGATLTSYAVAEGLKRRFAMEQAKPSLTVGVPSPVSLKDAVLFLIATGAIGLSFTSLRGNRWVRLIWQGMIVVGLGIYLGQFLSLAQFVGWARSGVHWSQSPGILALMSVALLVPWATRRQVYCHQICPHGAAQEWLGRFGKLHVRVPPQVHRVLSWIPGTTLCGAFLVALFAPGADLAQWEPFDAWILHGAAGTALFIALAGLITSLFVPQAYCHYGCPTGALLKFVRSSSSQERFGQKDRVALLLLAVGVGLCVWQTSKVTCPKSAPSTQTGHSRFELRGTGFGTTWSIQIKGDPSLAPKLRQEVAQEVERIERTLSPWHPDSATSRFNRAHTTDEVAVPKELGDIVSFAQKLSLHSNGAYDITVAPLVSAWGYGPAGAVKQAPTPVEVASLLERVGWQKLKVGNNGTSLQKTHPELSIILSLLQGYAVDRIRMVLNNHGAGDYLIELGGELYAKGEWRVAIEDPKRNGQGVCAFVLKDAALATSGLYRARRTIQGKEVSHIISPQTGRPLEPSIELCSVHAASCLEAKGWANAVMTSGAEKVREMARNNGLEVLWIDRAGQVEVTGSTFWGGESKVAGVAR